MIFFQRIQGLCFLYVFSLFCWFKCDNFSSSIAFCFLLYDAYFKKNGVSLCLQQMNVVAQETCSTVIARV